MESNEKWPVQFVKEEEITLALELIEFGPARSFVSFLPER